MIGSGGKVSFCVAVSGEAFCLRKVPKKLPKKDFYMLMVYRD